MESVFLHGVALANYRGIGPSPQLIGPFRRFNFMIGPNNAGKSCILNFIVRHLRPFIGDESSRYHSPQGPKLEHLDIHKGASFEEVVMAIGVPKEIVRAGVFSKAADIEASLQLSEAIDTIISELSDGEMMWLHHDRKSRKTRVLDRVVNVDRMAELVSHRNWSRIWTALTGTSGGDQIHHWIPETIESILHLADIALPDIGLIPAIREISPKGRSFDDWSGTGLIEELARHQNPGFTERDRYDKFQRINSFLQAVTQNATASIEVPFDREHVLVHMDDKVLPLEALGTGIHEVVMLAAFCTFAETQIICMEEPELHLHPLLQRRLIQYLQEKTDNQYFIATHSASFIDTPGGAVFHVSQEKGATVVRAAVTDESRADVCRDLGYKASDILQANAIIWVEGPSDRIYIRHWISQLAPDLREGVEYSIMFYGGRLLSHLSADATDGADEDIRALIAVRRLNRNLAVVIDSDKDKATADIRSTKLRIQAELEEHGGIAWITTGREIENYVATDLMSQALRETYASFVRRYKTGQYDHVLPFRKDDGKIFSNVDKIRIARAVCREPADLGVLVLNEHVAQIVEMIRSANA